MPPLNSVSAIQASFAQLAPSRRIPRVVTGEARVQLHAALRLGANNS
jgi:hypothetical protein